MTSRRSKASGRATRCIRCSERSSSTTRCNAVSARRARFSPRSRCSTTPRRRRKTTWGADAELTIVGQRAARMDAFEKVTGRARYTADTERPGMLYAAFVRAPIAHGHLRAIDLAPALGRPGVRAALTADDVPGIKVD